MLMCLLERAWTSTTLAWLLCAHACVRLFGLITYHKSLPTLILHICIRSSVCPKELKTWTMCGLYLLNLENSYSNSARWMESPWQANILGTMWNLVLDGLVEIFHKLWVHPKQKADDLATLGSTEPAFKWILKRRAQNMQYTRLFRTSDYTECTYPETGLRQLWIQSKHENLFWEMRL